MVSHDGTVYASFETRVAR